MEWIKLFTVGTVNAWPVLREAWWCALIAFSLNSGAYTAEILRGARSTCLPSRANW